MPIIGDPTLTRVNVVPSRLRRRCDRVPLSGLPVSRQGLPAGRSGAAHRGRDAAGDGTGDAAARSAGAACRAGWPRAAIERCRACTGAAHPLERPRLLRPTDALHLHQYPGRPRRNRASRAAVQVVSRPPRGVHAQPSGIVLRRRWPDDHRDSGTGARRRRRPPGWLPRSPRQNGGGLVKNPTRKASPTLAPGRDTGAPGGRRRRSAAHPLRRLRAPPHRRAPGTG